MAERTTAKAKKTVPAKPVTKAGVRAGSAAGVDSKIEAGAGGALLAENTRLKAELAEALERIADLELKHADAVNRIDRVIDSLHKLPK